MCNGAIVLALAHLAACRLVNIECEYIVGHSKGGSYSLGDVVSSGSKAEHAWNAVKVHGHWFLMDATWCAGHVTNGHFNWKFGESYFLMKPHNFVLTHLPSNSDW